jgi:hypothetical protein
VEDLKRNTLMFGNFNIKQREYDRYLGQVLHGDGLDQSAEATVKERSGRIKGGTMEIKGIIEEFPMQAIGGMIAAWELWEKAMVPSLLSGAGTWFGPNGGKLAIDLCENLQNFYWRIMLKVPESCPKLALRCETKMISMKWRVWQAKLLLLLKIKHQETTSLSRQVYEQGRANGWPGLAMEVTDICNQLGIPDLNNVHVSKEEIKAAIIDHHYNDLKEQLGKSNGKLEKIKDDDFSEIQGYFSDKSVENTRMAFKLRSEMVPDIPGNFKNKFRKKETGDAGLMCKYCNEEEIMTQSHCTVCPAWEELRRDLVITDIKDMVKFFRRLLDEREKLDKEVSDNRQHRTTPVTQ